MSVDSIEIQPLQKPLDAAVAVPGSKSYTNRALLVAALAEGESSLTGALFSDDTDYMVQSLRKLGVGVEANQATARFVVPGNGGKIPVDNAELYIGNSGTTSRSIISYVALGDGAFVVDGDEPMRTSRPISDLLAALSRLGVDARSRFDNGCLPVDVRARGFKGGKTQLDASKSSQFLTSLMLAGPHTQEGLDIEMLGEFKTQYIDITMAVMRAFGAEVEHENYRRFRIAGGQCYQARDYAIEPDASNASYFFAAAALTGGRVRIDDITADSAQGDIRFVDVLEQMGCTVNRDDKGIEVIGPEKLKGITVDMKAISDTSLTLAAIAPFAEGPVHIRNVEHSRWQETDRVAAMATELRRLGVEVEEHQDGISVSPSQPQPAAVDTYEDHRVAMSFALVGLKVAGIRINDPGCVSKTFPTYFEVWQALRN
ncbi:MAG TPA: 3-phosphoshikimate 1-carboxyvinyltransferase [Candidatus Latescibacteria bacterium]|nr:3-phosphoshikimate 1-carboxyvinyltransferase [Candidatus Handelsmanbacteria bacterium]HIL08559.1 3-phosphoshikimate 1-carboxyvinyltransferase [Candidatus Latescibacterota bacterium]